MNFRVKSLIIAVPFAVTMLSTPSHAEWRHHHGYYRGPGPGAVIAGTILGLGVGAAIAGILTPPPVYYAPAPTYYPPPPPPGYVPYAYQASPPSYYGQPPQGYQQGYPESYGQGYPPPIPLPPPGRY